MLVASKKKVDQILFPTVDYQYKTLNSKGDAHKIECKVGFYEIEKRKAVRFDKLTNEMVRGDVIKEEYVETLDEHGFKKIPYTGKTLIISIENSRYTRSTRPATEEDKIKYKEAYEAHLAHKAKEEERDAELKAAKEELAKLEKEKVAKESKDAKKIKEIKSE